MMHPYLRLIRFDKPIGTLLLWFPTAWALWLAQHGIPPLRLIFYFFIGTFLMRSAGCVFNDITDRHIDCHVERTVARPLTSGEITLQEAFLVLFGLLFAALFILCLLPKSCFFYAIFSFFITLLYPFTKRFFKAPQFIMSIAFSMGIPMAFAASHQALNQIAGLLFIINLCWALAYDTIYALSDQKDDARIGIHSTVLTFKRYTPLFINICFLVLSLLWLFMAHIYPLKPLFYLFWGGGTLLLIYQSDALFRKKKVRPLIFFKLHAYYGFLLWVSLILSI